MKQTITRTITTTTINHKIVDIVDGEPKFIDTEPLQVQGKLTEEQARKELKSYYNDYEDTGVKNFIIVSLKETTNTYEMSLNQFIEQAKIINKDGK